MDTLGVNDKITAYIKDELKCGIEPVKIIIDNPRKVGDLDNSGDINAIDIALFKKHLLGTLQLDATALAAADVNGDGSVDAIDFAIFKKYLLGTIPSFPVEQL